MKRARGLEPSREDTEVFDIQGSSVRETEGWTQIGTQTPDVNNSELAQLVNVWVELPEHVKQSISMLVSGWRK